MVELKNKNILIDKKATLLISGEVHYYRQKRDKWEFILDELIEYGCNCVAMYIPWLCHEAQEGDFDFNGRYREEHDLEYFMELVRRKGLYCIPRPGPFIMAEMKNEGIPYWVAKKYPELVPITWDGRVAPNPTLDYLNPNFLDASKKWYKAVMGVIKKHIQPNGGNVVALQLDNEVGMLSWVANAPDLTDFNLRMLSEWINRRYTKSGATKRYGFDVLNEAEAFKAFRSPNEDIALKLHKDLGYFMRHRFKLYFARLKEYAVEYGIKDIPFIINIHGCGGGRAFHYPIGLSQLYEAYSNDDGLMSGADYYLGELGMPKAQDLYMANAFTDCINSQNQPLSAMEFEAGDGNYGNNFSSRNSPQSTAIKARMMIAQGAKLNNYYTFSGGYNYRLDNKPNDGNDRIAITGEMHGYAAPLNGYLKRTTTFEATARTNKTFLASMDSLADMSEQTDNIVLGFIPDYFMREYHYPQSKSNKNMISLLARTSEGGHFEVLGKSLIQLNYRFKALDIQKNDISTALKKDKALVLASAWYMSEELQQNIVKYIKGGGGVFLYGALPAYDMEGNACTVLADYLGAKNLRQIEKTNHFDLLSVYPLGALGNGEEEVRVDWAQACDLENGEVLMRTYGTEQITAFTAKMQGGGRVVCMMNTYRAMLPFMDRLFSYIGASHAFSHNYEWQGIFITTCKNTRDERFVHIINLDCLDKTIDITENGAILYPQLLLKNREALMLPLNVTALDGVVVKHSTAEIYDKTLDSLSFRLTQNYDKIILKTARKIASSEEYKITSCGDEHEITLFSKARLSDILTIKFE